MLQKKAVALSPLVNNYTTLPTDLDFYFGSIKSQCMLNRTLRKGLFCKYFNQARCDTHVALKSAAYPVSLSSGSADRPCSVLQLQ